MAGMHSTHMHLPKHIDVQDKVANFWKEEAVASNPIKHTMQPIVTGSFIIILCCKSG